MGDTFVISGLKNKYAHLLGELKACQARVEDLKAALPHVRATIKLFDEDFDIDAVEAIGSVNRQSQWFKSGECTWTVLDVMRDAKGPRSAREVAIQVMRRCNIPEDQARIVKVVTLSVYDALRRRENDLFVASGSYPRRWTLLDAPPPPIAIEHLL